MASWKGKVRLKEGKNEGKIGRGAGIGGKKEERRGGKVDR